MGYKVLDMLRGEGNTALPNVESFSEDAKCEWFGRLH